MRRDIVKRIQDALIKYKDQSGKPTTKIASEIKELDKDAMISNVTIGKFIDGHNPTAYTLSLILYYLDSKGVKVDLNKKQKS